MIKHFFQITAITGFIAICMFLPYIPGDYDGFAVTLSIMAQLSGIASVLLVPPGIIWLISEIKSRRQKNLKQPGKRYRFAIVALVLSGIVSLMTALGAFISNNRSLAIITLAVCSYVISKVAAKIKQLKNEKNDHFNPTPFYLICIPILAVFMRFTFVAPATKFSRSYAIRNSERLLNDIEAYKDKNGYYPKSLLSVWEDYKPCVRGINRYHYEQSGNAYNLYFEQFSDQLGVREIVMYNKLDEQEMTSHNQDLLQLSPENISRGYHVVYSLPNPHWKYFWFD